jgi:hypothetical protein
LRSETSTDDEAKHSTEKGPEEITEKQNKAPGKEIKNKAKAVASYQQQSNWTVRFNKPDGLVLPYHTELLFGVTTIICCRTLYFISLPCM